MASKPKPVKLTKATAKRLPAIAKKTAENMAKNKAAIPPEQIPRGTFRFE